MQNGTKEHKSDINLWIMPNAGLATRQMTEPSVQQFERENPGVRVRLTVHPWSVAWNRLIDVIKGRYMGPKPDVVQIGTTYVATLAYLGALDKVPEGALIQDDVMSTTIWDPGTQSTADHELFCVPWFIDVRVLYYRRDLFEQLNIKPELLHEWRGFIQACTMIQQYIKSANGRSTLVAPVAFPGQKPGVLMHDLAPWIWGAGGDFCSEDLTQATLSSPETVKGCESFFDLINHGFMPLPNGSVPQGNFFTGNYAMQFTGSWPGATYLNPKSPYSTKEVVDGFGVVLLPAGPQGRFTFLGGSNLGVTSVSENKDIAWKLVRFLSEPSRQLAHAKSIGALTARLASLEELFVDHPKAKRVFWDSLGHARRLPRLVELGSVEQIIYKMGLRVLSLIRLGEYSPKLLEKEIATANNGMSAVLSLHRYGSKAPAGAGS